MDIFLLPMFHVLGAPFKFSFIYLIIWYIVKRPFNRMLMPVMGLIIALWLGKIMSYFIYDMHSFDQTMFMTLNYGVIFIGFAYGLRYSPKKMNWLFTLIILFVLINIVIMIFWRSSPNLIRFYNLEFRLESGLFDYRNPGTLSNPNGSAMALNLLLLFWVIAKQYKLIDLSNAIYDMLLFILGFIVIVSFGSKSGFLAYFIILGYAFRDYLKQNAIKVFMVVIVAVVAVTTLTSYVQNKNIGSFETGISTFFSLDDKIQNEFSKDNSLDGSRIYKLKHALESWLRSPIWGFGADRSASNSIQSIQYHNDGSEILVNSGSIGLFLFALIVLRIFKIHPILIVPFIFPGMTNSFFFTAQYAMCHFIMVGIFYQAKTNRK